MYRINLRTKITFGEHKGKRMSELPTSYLEWLVDNIETFKWNETAKRILEERKKV